MDEHPSSPLMQQLPFKLKMRIIKLLQDESPKDQFEKHILDVVCGKSEAASPEESKWVEYAKWVKNPPQQETTQMQQLPFDLKMTIIKLLQDESPKDQFEKHILDVVCGKSEAASPEESKWVEYAKWVKNPPQQETTKKRADKKKPRPSVDAGIQAAHSVDQRRRKISQNEKEGVMADVGFLASPSCPTCGDVMKQRFPGEGTVKGNAFWGCSGYPKCRDTRKMDRIDVLRSLRDDIGEGSSDEVKWDHGDDDLNHDPWDY